MKTRFVLLALVAVLAALAVWGYTEGRREAAEEQARERPVKAPARVVSDAGGTAVVLDAATQKRAGIAVVPVQATVRRAQIEAFATVLPVQELTDLRGAYVAAETQAERSRAALQASRSEYERVTALHGDEQNLSLKALETAQAAWRADEAAARGASAALDAVARDARQKWGRALAADIAADAPLFRRLADQRAVLLRVAVPAGAPVADAAERVRVAANDGRFRTARLVSPSPQADPRIQGPAFFYAAPADGLLPGTTVTAYLPTGAERAGALVPAAAAVWWQGKAWLYVRTAPDRFVRQALPAAAEPVDDGWFVPGMPKGTPLVVRGAQTLLSEALRDQIQVGDEGEGDE